MTKSSTIRRVVAAESAVLAGALAARRRYPVLAAGMVAAAALGAWAAFRPGSLVLGPVLRHGPRDRPRAALTFDDGPGP
ncbi:MAG: hypothetical protein ACPG7S_04725, partial [Miltoncostaeaceae bacterium]